MIEEKQSLLANFLANSRMTKSLAAEYHNYMNHKMLELQFGKGKLYHLYKVWLLTQKALASRISISDSDFEKTFMETDEGDDIELEIDNMEKNFKPVSFMETDEGDDDELENDNMEKNYKPVSLKFWYSVLNNVIFTEAKAHNCYCATCLTAKQLFPEYFRLFMQDCRALHSCVLKDMLTGEIEANVEAKRWVADEFHDKNDVTFDMSLWECEDMYGRIPIEALQTDHHSCGPFAVVCLELIVADLLWEQKKWYTQRDMQVHFRHRLLVEIHKGKIEY
jgi:hypothetical protein